MTPTHDSPTLTFSVLILALAAVVMYRLVLRAEKILNRYWGVIQ